MKISINVTETIKSSQVRSITPRKPTVPLTMITKQSKTLKNLLIDCIAESNFGLLQDILNRYTNDESYNGIRDERGNTLVCIAAMHGDWRIMKLLLSSGFDPSIPNDLGDTPLHLAI